MAEKFHVEQIGKLTLRLLFLTAFLFLAGCRKPDPNPELRDPIYQAVKKEADESEKALDAAKKAKALAYEQLRNAEARTIELKDAEREYWKAVKTVDQLTTAARYLRIRSERRKLEARLSYQKAFDAGKEQNWPDPDEYAGYLTNKRLREASLNWNRRVPKLQDRIPSSKK